MAELTLDKSKTAVILADFHADTLGDNPHATERKVLENSRSLLEAARRAGVMVIYVVVAFREGYIEVHTRNREARAGGRPAPTDPLARIHPTVAPKTGEPVVVKHRTGPFLGTDFDMILRANGIETLVLAGHATSGVILSTVRYAADADYQMVVVEDCCADRDPEVHNFLIEKLFPRQATVANSQEVIRALKES